MLSSTKNGRLDLLRHPITFPITCPRQSGDSLNYTQAEGVVINYGEGTEKRGGASKLLPLQKKGGGGVSAMKKGGHKTF